MGPTGAALHVPPVPFSNSLILRSINEIKPLEWGPEVQFISSEVERILDAEAIRLEAVIISYFLRASKR